MNTLIALPGLIEQIATALVASRLHEPGHPGFEKPLTAVIGHLDLLHQETGEATCSLLVLDDGLVLQGQCQVPPSLSASRVVEVLRRRNAAGLRFGDGVSAEEIGTLLRLLVRARDGEESELATIANAAARAGCRRISLIASSSGAARAGMSAALAHVSTAGVVDSLTDAFTGIAAGGSLDLGDMTTCVATLASTIDNAVRPGGAELDLSSQPEDDPLAVRHAVRVCALSIIAARSLTGDAELVSRIGLAALLHDVGRMMLPLDLMQAGAELDPDTEQAILEHPVLGGEFLMSQQDVDPLCIAVAFGHHRSFAGTTGYPVTCHEHKPSRFTELVRIADKFEALTAERGRRGALTPSHAYRIMLADSDDLEPGLFRQFVEANGLHPLGTVVQLSTGETARVARQTDDLEAPIVRVLSTGRSGTPQGGLIDLSRTRGAAARIVLADPSAAAG